MWQTLGTIYGVFLALDVRLLTYVLAASALVAAASVLGMRRLLRIRHMVAPALIAFILNLVVLWLIFDIFLDYPLFRIQSVFEIP